MRGPRVNSHDRGRSWRALVDFGGWEGDSDGE